jgi:hypothetical protein
MRPKIRLDKTRQENGRREKDNDKRTTIRGRYTTRTRIKNKAMIKDNDNDKDYGKDYGENYGIKTKARQRQAGAIVVFLVDWLIQLIY